MGTEALIGILTFFLLFVIFMPFGDLVPRRNFKKLIAHINDQSVEQARLSALSLFEKIFNISEKYYRFIKGTVKPKDYDRFAKHIITGGLSNRVSVEGAMASRYTLALLLFIYMFFLGIVLGIFGFAFLGIFLAIGGYMLPELFLKNQVKVRQVQIKKEIPSVLNTMAIMTDAGLGLFEAIDKVCEIRSGEFVEELRKVNEEVKMGVLRKEAFLRMSDRCEVAEVSTFVSALVQVLEKGASGISVFIREQAFELWSKRLSVAKELGAKASLKLFLPMLVLVFPAVLIFLMGPVILNMVEDFSSAN